ncbi:hypothetical protein V3H18_14615 [Methylocystis sp. 9N]|uniref:Uncharacterized protein n=1 Tax=Methylocystis borbori TaxID=3118750 RepID=A0ABU7XKW2_9HYPH
MSDKFSIDFNQPQPSGHPHDLLARLYREIGISAVAAALEVEHFAEQAAAAKVETLDDRRTLPALLSEDLAA